MINRAFFLFIVFVFATLQHSCDTQSISSSVNSIGGFDEIMVVADEKNLEQYLREPLRKTFRAPFDIVPQDEPAFDARILDYEKFDAHFRKFRTIVFVADLSEENTLTNFVVQQIGEENTARALNDPDFYLAAKNDMWASPQKVFFLFAPTKQQLLERLKHIPALLQRISVSELEKYKNNVYTNKLNFEITKKLREEANIALPIPKEFVLAIHENDFFWIRHIDLEFDINIMTDQKPWSADTFPDAVQWRDSLGKKFISTTIDSSYMISDTILPFARREMKINEFRVIETRGLWKMVNDFMGGPFLNYLILDEKRQRMIMLDGFVYAPGEKNKPFVRKTEAIFRQFGNDEVR